MPIKNLGRGITMESTAHVIAVVINRKNKSGEKIYTEIYQIYIKVKIRQNGKSIKDSVIGIRDSIKLTKERSA